jgi:KaiC/GvpD/RAD55 family RecA-like ATPase
MSLAGIHQVPQKSVILLSGPPGAGKSTFCHEVVLDSLAMDRPVVFVSTEQGPAEIVGHLRDKGMGELPPGALHFVDVFAQTVGLATPQRADTLHANCQDLNSLSMAIAKLQQRIATRDILLAFDSLTSPYLFNKEEMFRFIKLCLLKFAAEGNSVLALVDEGCGKEQDLVAMMSVVDGVIKIEMGKDRRFLNVIKHPRLRATRVEVPVRPNPTIKCAFDLYRSKAAFQAERMRQWVRSMSAQGRATMRAEVGEPLLAESCALEWHALGPQEVPDHDVRAKQGGRPFLHGEGDVAVLSPA